MERARHCEIMVPLAYNENLYIRACRFGVNRYEPQIVKKFQNLIKDCETPTWSVASELTAKVFLGGLHALIGKQKQQKIKPE